MSTGDSVTSGDHASSKFVWPPTIYGTATLVCAILTWILPLSFLPKADVSAARAFGIAAIVAGVFFALAAGQVFRRARTPVAPTKPSTALVTNGIYRWTRNPMYLGLSLILLGIGFATGSLWFLMGLPMAILAVTKLAIEREERYLAEKFGAAYLDYKSRVRRWI